MRDMPGSDQKKGISFCEYGTLTLQDLVDAFEAQFIDFNAESDPERIHDMRVSSRRLRAALPVFKDCFLPKRYHWWMKEVRRITRALGAARDEDVQIAFIREKISGSLDPVNLPGLEYLLKILLVQRDMLQPGVENAIGYLAKTAVVDDIREVLKDVRGKKKKRPGSTYDMSLYRRAQIDIMERIQGMLVFESSLNDHTAIEEHHKMRIAAKWLRYTMEIYAPLYNGTIDPFIARAKEIQTFLGTLHDLDVWIGMLPIILADEKVLLQGQGRESTLYRVIEPGADSLLMECRMQREQGFREFQEFWRKNGGSSCWEDLEGLLGSPV